MIWTGDRVSVEELAALYYAPTDNPELECRTGVGASMPTPSPLEIIDEGDRITVHQAEYEVLIKLQASTLLRIPWSWRRWNDRSQVGSDIGHVFNIQVCDGRLH